MTFKWTRPDGGDCRLCYRDKDGGGGLVTHMRLAITGDPTVADMSDFLDIGEKTLSGWRSRTFAMSNPDISRINWQLDRIEGWSGGTPMAIYKVAPRAA